MIFLPSQYLLASVHFAPSLSLVLAYCKKLMHNEKAWVGGCYFVSVDGQILQFVSTCMVEFQLKNSTSINTSTVKGHVLRLKKVVATV